MKSGFLKTLGPGILFASTAIGVSHLVQSTRAGADFGFTLVWAIVLANVFKYPFFEFGSRYASVKKESIIDGYLTMGRWMLWVYLLITLATMFFVCSAVCAVTAGFMQNLFGLDKLLGENSTLITNVFLVMLGVFLLALGKYKTLDSLIKVIASVLLVSTLVAFFLTVYAGPVNNISSLLGEFKWKGSDAFFLIALMGWMPTAVDLSTWNSLWTLERMDQTGYRPSLKETLREFNLGYIVSGLLSICFLTLGAFVMFGSGAELSNSGAVFANQVIQMFVQSIGDWSYIIIASAAFSIMLGTFIAVLDGYSRSMTRTVALLQRGKKDNTKTYNATLLTLAIGSLGIIYFFLIASKNAKGFKALVDVATTLSFLVAPVIAIANYKLVTQKSFPARGVPPKWMRVLSILGILFLVGFSLYGLFIYSSS